MSDTTAPSSIPPTSPVSFSREFTGTFGGTTVPYRAIAGETFIRDESGAPVASFFTISYVKSNVEALSARPVSFIFNGGPGSSAQWLHMGAFGPKRVDVPSEPDTGGAPPYAILDNPSSILDVSDLVFIDPIGTGYSRTLGTKAAADYWGLLEDARSIADFIQTWITEQRRWNSPRYIIGESYGTTRASLVADILTKRYIALNGLVLISAVLDYQNSRPRPGDGGIMPYASFLPTYAATAWYHRKVKREGRSLESFLEEVRTFARTDYALALIANTRQSKAEFTEMAARVAACTGLKESYVRQSNLRIPVNRYFKELLRDEGLVLGRLDGRYAGVEPDSVGESPESDPTVDAIASAYTTSINVQLDELGVSMQRPYLPLIEVKSWNWLLEEKTANGGGYINVVPHLGRAMRQNKDLRVLVASGYYDFATPFFGAENALAEFGVVPDRISWTYYEVGHMIFLHEPSRLKFLDDIRDFIGPADTRNEPR